MRPIDADELKKRLAAEHCDCEMMQIIDDMPTVKPEITYREERIAVGHWVELDGKKLDDKK